MENWKPINDRYAVSDLGNIFRYKATPGSTQLRLLKASKNQQGYRQLSMFNGDGKEKKVLIHRLVWEAFKGKIPKGLVINHLDGVKDNNQLSNLEVCTYAENSRHSIDVLGNVAVGGMKKGVSKPTLRKLSDTQVEEIKELIANGGVIGKIADRYGVCRNTITRIKFGKTCY